MPAWMKTGMGYAEGAGRAFWGNRAGRAATWGAGIGAVGGGIYGGVSDRGSVLGGAASGAFYGAVLGAGGAGSRMAYSRYAPGAIKRFNKAALSMQAAGHEGGLRTSMRAASYAARGVYGQAKSDGARMLTNQGNKITNHLKSWGLM